MKIIKNNVRNLIEMGDLREKYQNKCFLVVNMRTFKIIYSLK